MNFVGSPPVANAWKYAGESLDYGIDWYYTGDPPWLLVDESIIDSAWTFVDGYTDGALELFNLVYTSTGTGFWSRYGSVGFVYLIQNTIQTDKGRTGVARISLYVR